MTTADQLQTIKFYRCFDARVSHELILFCRVWVFWCCQIFIFPSVSYLFFICLSPLLVTLIFGVTPCFPWHFVSTLIPVMITLGHACSSRYESLDRPWYIHIFKAITWADFYEVSYLYSYHSHVPLLRCITFWYQMQWLVVRPNEVTVSTKDIFINSLAV